MTFKTLLVLAGLLFAYPAHADLYVTQQQITFVATVTSTQAIASNLDRKYILIQNRGAASIYVKANSAHSGTEGLEIVSSGNWEPIVVPVDAFFIRSASGSVNVTIIEGH